MSDDRLRSKRDRRRRRRSTDEATDAHNGLPSSHAGAQIAVRPEAHAEVRGQSSADTAEESNKRVAFYQASIESFLENRMERDKSLLTLSTAGVGVTITLWTTIGVSTRLEFGLGIGAAVAFMIAILLVLWIFGENANYLEKLATQQDFERPHRKLRSLDFWLGVAFSVGLTLALAGAVTLTYRKYLANQVTATDSAPMSDKSEKKPGKPSIATGIPASPATDGLKPANENLQNFHKLSLQNQAPAPTFPSSSPAPQSKAQPGDTSKPKKP